MEPDRVKRLQAWAAFASKPETAALIAIPGGVPGVGRGVPAMKLGMTHDVIAGSPSDGLDAASISTLFTPALHEFYASTVDHIAMSGLVLGLLRARAQNHLLWIRQEFLDVETGRLSPHGFQEYGLDPQSIICVRVRNARAALQAGLEAARCKALGGIVLELNGETPAYDLTASRRFMLALRASGRPLFLLRSGAAPIASAAETRWRVRSHGSQPMAASAPGKPAFELELLRARNGVAGRVCRLEWNRDAGRFEDAASPRIELRSVPSSVSPEPAALSGSVVSLFVHRPGEAGGQAIARAG